MASGRRSTYIHWFLGPFGSFKLPQNPLPSWLDIMKKYKWERAIMVDGNNQTRGYLTYDQEMAIFSNIADELLELWKPSNITTMVRKKVQDKISRLVKVYKFLEKDYAKKAEKNENWKIDIHKEPGKSLEKFKKLFDIAQCQCFKNCTDPEMIISSICSCDFPAKIATLKHDENGFTDLEYYADQKFERVMLISASTDQKSTQKLQHARKTKRKTHDFQNPSREHSPFHGI